MYGIVFCFFYLVFLLWQTYYAILTVRTSAWGTRPATAGQAQQADGAGPGRVARARDPDRPFVMTRLLSLFRGMGALALLPLSAVPLLLVGPSLVSSHARFDRKYHSAPFAPPAVYFTPATLARYEPVAPYTGAVPVLAYHGINANNDHYSVSREEFARQMAMLEHSGYRTITIAQYLRFRAGDDRGLPAAADPHHLRRRAPGQLPRRRQGARPARDARRHVRDHRAREGRATRSTCPGRSCTGCRTPGAGTSSRMRTTGTA